MGFDLNSYEEVKDRIPRFWEKHPDGAITTDIVHHGTNSFIVKAMLISAAGTVIATGLAQETVGSSPVNKTSALENCETSAIGRALANAGFSSGSQRPSREEMRKVDAPAPAQKPTPGATPTTQATDKQRGFIRKLSDRKGAVPDPELCGRSVWPLPDDLTKAEASKVIDWLNDIPDEPLAERAKTLRDRLGAEEVDLDAPF